MFAYPLATEITRTRSASRNAWLQRRRRIVFHRELWRQPQANYRL